MPNWFKKLVNKIKDDQEENDGLEQSDAENTNTYNQPRARISSKQVEAKVSYHYPTGNFRFPVIPDEEKSNSHRSTSRQRERQMDNEKKKVSKRSETIEKSNIQRRNTTEKSSKVETSSFKPTQIPSPVYGFKARNETKYDNDVVRPMYEKEQKEQVKVWTKDDELEFLSITSRQSRSMDQEQVTIEDELLNKKLMHESNQKFLKHHESVDVDITEDEVTKVTNDEHSLFEAVQSSDELHEESTFIPDVIHEEDNSFPSESVHNKSIESDFLGISHEQHLDEKSEDKEQQPVPPSLSTSNHAQNEANVTVRDESKSPQTSTIKTSSRSSVPYNVMMLNRDRRAMKEQSRGAFSSNYQFPSIRQLDIPTVESEDDQQWLNEQMELLEITLANFNVKAKVVGVAKGPAVTRFEVQPEPGVKVNKITNLSDDIKLSLAAKDIRIEAPIPGRNAVGIEVPNRKSHPVFLREILRSPAFMQNSSPLTAALGLDISGNPIVTDLMKMPHGLIAGATGSGKSVCINSILVSLIYKASPHEVKLLLIDPKMVELAPYNGIPHLVSPVITDVKAATAALKWAVEEMEQRYVQFAHEGVRDINRYNQKMDKVGKKERMPYIVIIIDELADLMMVSPQDVEDAICRIAQKARACGIHLLLATQRPSVDVITGLIKANIPTRAAFSVSSQIDSRTILDTSGAEKLLGKGDMLFLENGASKPIRIQGNFVSDDEIERVTEHAKKQMKPTYLFEQEELMKQSSVINDEDELFTEACEFVVNQGGASSSSLQRRFRIGFNRAARLIDMMENQGIVSEAKGSKPRDVLLTEEQLEQYKDQ